MTEYEPTTADRMLLTRIDDDFLGQNVTEDTHIKLKKLYERIEEDDEHGRICVHLVMCYLRNVGRMLQTVSGDILIGLAQRTHPTWTNRNKDDKSAAIEKVFRHCAAVRRLAGNIHTIGGQLTAFSTELCDQTKGGK